jgi:hypothetical protein
MCQAQQKEFNLDPGHAQGLVRGSVEREWADFVFWVAFT